MCAQKSQTSLNIFVASVDLFDIADDACAVGGECCDEQGDAGANVGRRHAGCAETDAVVVTYDDGAVRVAQDNLCSHVDEAVHKEEAAFEHFLVNEHCALCLGGHHEHDAE